MTERQRGFERHAEEQRLRWLSLTPEERLRWLERAKRFAQVALTAARAREAQGATASPPIEDAPPRAKGT